MIIPKRMYQKMSEGEVETNVLIGRIGWLVSEISQRRVMTDVELKDIERIKQLLQRQSKQNAILQKELQSLEEQAFRGEIEDGKREEWLDKFQDAITMNNDPDYREAKSKLKKLLQTKVVTREWIRETVKYLEMATDPISAEGALEDRLNGLGIGVEAQ